MHEAFGPKRPFKYAVAEGKCYEQKLNDLSNRLAVMNNYDMRFDDACSVVPDGDISGEISSLKDETLALLMAMVNQDVGQNEYFTCSVLQEDDDREMTLHIRNFSLIQASQRFLTQAEIFLENQGVDSVRNQVISQADEMVLADCQDDEEYTEI